MFVLLVGGTALWLIMCGGFAIYSLIRGDWDDLAVAVLLAFAVPAVFWAVYGAMAWACKIIDKPPRE